MPDREKVIEGLQELLGFLFNEYGKAQAEEASLYYDRFLAVDNAIDLLKDCDTQLQYRDDHIAMYQAEIQRLEALLKEQEAVKPRVSSVEQRCGNCNKVIEMDGWKACPWCGKPILWETVGRSVK